MKFFPKAEIELSNHTAGCDNALFLECVFGTFDADDKKRCLNFDIKFDIKFGIKVKVFLLILVYINH
jgi:hypothetical protein